MNLASSDRAIVTVLRFIYGTRCEVCGAPGRWSRQRTAYVYDWDNFVCFCDTHHVDNDAYWDERWAEYYRGCL